MSSQADAHTEQPSLEGKKAIVTGGTTGIGRAIAVLLASYGVDVFICGRDPQHLEDALGRINEVGKGDGIAIDLSEADNVKRLFDAGTAYLGGLDIAVINAAGAAQGIADTDEAELRHAIATDFTAYLLSAHAANAALKDHGNIVFVGSMSAHVLGGGSSIYSGIKYGIQGFAEALRKELAPKGIQVGVVEPGKTGADMQYESFSAQEQADAINREEMLRAEDIAVATHFMLTQPRRAVVQQVTVAPRQQPGE
ncbi:SDR family oxidoreductase [uncultured Sphingomonas sp.]|uniref:SDR family oxidoreductase n=1 Tax=uncultured Sphingomonas sp. TaxID=158754 RepID=UPI0025F3F7AA|nr:SDR family oxidoreductase [uncultured Sphingomonas sp.]